MNAQIGKRMDDIYAWIDEQAVKAADEWFKQQCADPYAALYLYHKRGELRVAADAPDGFELSDGRRLASNKPKLAQKIWIADVARNLPILPEELL